MSPKANQKISERESAQPFQDGFSQFLSRNQTIILLIIVIFIGLILEYKPLVFGGKEVGGSDKVSGIGSVHQIQEYNKNTGNRALWNPYVFGGMPRYHRYGGVIWSIDSLISELDAIIDWRVIYLLLGVIGVYFLCRYLGLSKILGIIAGLGYALMPHFQSLIVVGHNSKFRALMWIPFVLLTFLMFSRRRDILSALLFSLAMSLQIRTQHYQIIFYTLLLLIFSGIGIYIKLILDKKWKEFGKLNGLLVGCVVLVFLIVSQPLLSIAEYTPHSTRGGNAISLTEQKTPKSGGVSFDYATSWSYSISGLWDLVIPKFHGGTSQEKYTGNKVPQLKNRIIPAYWGPMPFTQSYEYMGVIAVFFALMAVILKWDKSIVKSLALLTLFAFLLSLGKHFPALYKLFFFHVPLFNKFRAPVMILTLIMFNVMVLGAIGIEAVLKVRDQLKLHKRVYITLGIYLVILILPLLFASNFSLTTPREIQQFTQQYGQQQGQQVIQMLSNARLDILQQNTLRSLLFFILAVGLVVVYLKQWVSPGMVMVGLLLFISLDMGLISQNYLQGKFIDTSQLERQYYQQTHIDQIIQQDHSYFRVAPLVGNLTNNTRWSYNYQSLGGYSAAKLQVIQDIFDNNLNHSLDQLTVPFNMNILNMLNCKYIVTRHQVNSEQLQFLGQDQQNRLLYENLTVDPRAYFVDSVKVIPNAKNIVRTLNSARFDPEKVALIKNPLPEQISAPDSSQINITEYGPNQIKLNVYTDKQGLLVISEIYYPEGWHALLDNAPELPIYQTNHVMRSVVIPAGEHTLTLTFHPKAYYAGIKLSLIGMILIYGGILLLLYIQYGDQLRAFISSKK